MNEVFVRYDNLSNDDQYIYDIEIENYYNDYFEIESQY